MTQSSSVPPNVVQDSRRLTGRGLVLDSPGAVLDVRLEEPDLSRAIAAWRRSARILLDQLGWTGETLGVRTFDGGASLALSAPLDSLYGATDLNELAWDAAMAEVRGEPPVDLESAVEPIRARVQEEANPRLLALHRAARERGLTFLTDEDGVSIGSGAGVRVWRPDDLPTPGTVDWSGVHDVPIVLVTGSNGKTTVVRLIASLVSSGNLTVGISSTEGVTIGPELVGEGDFSGPSGARLVLRDKRVGSAILETARGGLLRRGLAVDHADVAVVTNIAADHLGEFGVQNLQDLAETKLLVARTLGTEGTLVLNADDALLVEKSRQIRSRIIWFSLNPASPLLRTHLTAGGAAVVVDGDQIVIARGADATVLMPLAEVPITFSGKARHNVANTLAAIAAGMGLGISLAQMAGALRQFGSNAGDNPGRANLMTVGGIKILLDYAHNPHGMSALVEVAKSLPAERRLVMVGQAGDRDDEAIRDLARSAWELRPEQVVIKEMDQYLRGRAPGEVPALLEDEFRRLGAGSSTIVRVDPELDGARAALTWARQGDLLVLVLHQERRAVLQLLEKLSAANWRAGEPLPA
jgi:cyanophycin synthetase